MTQVFISYSRTDMEFVQRLAMDLEREGFDVWWDLTDIQGSDVWERKIEEGLRTSQYFIVVLSLASLESRWVRREYLSADNTGIKIIPLKLKPYDVTPLTLRDIQPVDAIDRRYEDVLSDVVRSLKGADAIEGKSATVPEKGLWNQITDLLLAKGTRGVDVGGTLLLIAYFLLTSLSLLVSSDDAIQVLLSAAAVLAGIFFLIKKQIPESGL
ncbi:MAG TPA: toll/interleukin-1 receptor domain-containing protein, partial [Anaerolineales bacterium]|nr:toll/interleukin-1 receptor domain-containing protein [Anaerolineales bacterium]